MKFALLEKIATRCEQLQRMTVQRMAIHTGLKLKKFSKNKKNFHRCVHCCENDLCNDGGFIPEGNDAFEEPDYSPDAIIDDKPTVNQSSNSLLIHCFTLSFIISLI